MARSFKSFVLACGLLTALLTATGCSSLLPQSTKTDSPFRRFESARDAFASIKVGVTRSEDLAALKIDPNEQGVSLHSAVVLIPFYIPHEGASLDLHDEGVRTCAENRENCVGWVIDINRRSRKRTGGWWMDRLRFKRIRDNRGFDFTGTLLVVDDVVVHKIWSAVPNHRTIVTEIRPLGFLQGGVKIAPTNPLELPPFTVRIRGGIGRANAGRLPKGLR